MGSKAKRARKERAIKRATSKKKKKERAIKRATSKISAKKGGKVPRLKISKPKFTLPKGGKLFPNKIVMRNIQRMVAYCVAANDKATDLSNRHPQSFNFGIIHLIKKVAAQFKPGDNAAFHYLTAFAAVKRAATRGLGKYILHHIHRAVVHSKHGAVSSVLSQGKLFAGLSKKTLGLTTTPVFVRKLRVPFKAFTTELGKVLVKGVSYSRTSRCLRQGKTSCRGPNIHKENKQKLKRQLAISYVKKFQKERNAKKKRKTFRL